MYLIMPDRFANGDTANDRPKGAPNIIDRAKGVLMKAKKYTEEEAYALLRKTAMNENKKITEIAQSVIMAADLFK